MGFFTPTIEKVQTAALVFAGWSFIWLVELATLWALAIDSPLSVLLEWSLWRIPNLVLAMVDIGVFALYQGGDRYRPAIVVALVTGATVLSDVAAFCTFTVQYVSCVAQIQDGTTLTDPLCMTANLKVVGGYHIAICGVLLLGSTLSLIVPILMIRLRDKPTQGQSLRSRVSKYAGTLNNRRLLNVSLFGRGLTILTGCVALLAMEVSILTNASDIKYLWFCHLLTIVPAVLTAWPVFLTQDKINKVGTAIAIADVIVATLGAGLMGWYFDYLCLDNPPKTGFSNFTKCEIGYTGAVYMVVIHTLLTAISLVRLVCYAFILRLSSATVFSDSETDQFTENLKGDSFVADSDSNYGSAYKRKVIPDDMVLSITSNLTGGNLNL